MTLLPQSISSNIVHETALRPLHGACESRVSPRAIITKRFLNAALLATSPTGLTAFFTGLFRQNKPAVFVRYSGQGHILESPANTHRGRTSIDGSSRLLLSSDHHARWIVPLFHFPVVLNL